MGHHCRRTLVRHHQGAYDGVAASLAPAERQLTEGTLTGLRFVRNLLGNDVDPADFIRPRGGRVGPGDVSVTAWTWKSAPAPALASLSYRGQAWALAR